MCSLEDSAIDWKKLEIDRRTRVLLQGASRRFISDDHAEFVMAYDIGDTERVVAYLVEQILNNKENCELVSRQGAMSAVPVMGNKKAVYHK